MHSKHPNWCRKHIGRIGKQNQQGCLVRRPIRWNNRRFQTAPLISWYPAQPHTKTLLCFLLYLTEVAHQPAEVLKSVGRTLFTAFLLISQGSGVHSPAFTSFIFFSFLFSIFFLLKKYTTNTSAANEQMESAAFVPSFRHWSFVTLLRYLPPSY